MVLLRAWHQVEAQRTDRVTPGQTDITRRPLDGVDRGERGEASPAAAEVAAADRLPHRAEVPHCMGSFAMEPLAFAEDFGRARRNGVFGDSGSSKKSGVLMAALSCPAFAPHM